MSDMWKISWAGGRVLNTELLKEWLGTALGAPVDAVFAVAVEGATSSSLYRLRLRASGVDHGLVLRRFTNQAWLAEESDLVRHEVACLVQAQLTGIPVPRFVAADETGDVCGAPAVLMTELPGAVDLMPADRVAWLRAMAEALASIHQVDARGFRWQYRPYRDMTRLEVPAWSRRPDAWAKAQGLLQAPPPTSQRCFIHRDFHPCNLLWQGDRLSGVVDWVNGCGGPAGVDVGHCRINLALLLGVTEADAFLDFYQASAGPSFTYHPYWDLVTLMDFLTGPPQVYPGWTAFGATGLTDELMAQRTEAYLASLLRRY